MFARFGQARHFRERVLDPSMTAKRDPCVTLNMGNKGRFAKAPWNAGLSLFLTLRKPSFLRNPDWMTQWRF